MPRGSLSRQFDPLLNEFISQSLQEKRIRGRQEQRAAKIRQLYLQYTDPNAVLPPMPEEMAGERRREAAAGLLGMGIQVPKEKEKTNWSPMFDAMNLEKDHWLRVLAPELSDQQVIGLAFRIKPDFGKTDAELDAVMPLFAGTEQEGKKDLIRAAMQAVGFLTKEAITGLVGLRPKEADPMEVINSVIYDDQGKLRAFETFTAAEKLMMADAGISDNELKAAYNIADDDMTADQIFKIKRQFINNSLMWLGLRMASADDEKSMAAIVQQVQNYIPIFADFLRENKLTPEMQEVLDFLNREQLQKLGKAKVRELLKEAALEGLDDNAIEVILQVGFHGK